MPDNQFNPGPYGSASTSYSSASGRTRKAPQRGHNLGLPGTKRRNFAAHGPEKPYQQAGPGAFSILAGSRANHFGGGRRPGLTEPDRRHTAVFVIFFSGHIQERPA